MDIPEQEADQDGNAQPDPVGRAGAARAGDTGAGSAGHRPVRSAIVVNPAKVMDLDRRRAEICDALARAGWAEPMWLPTTREDPGCGQARQAVEAGVEVVFAFGGDGTVRAVTGELAGTDVALAILPSGTGNLLAANLELPDDVLAGVAVATGGQRRRVDVGVVDGRTFTVMAGMGFDAEMVGDAPEPVKAKLGWPAYVLSALRHLHERPMRVAIRLNDGPLLRRRARAVVVGNVGRLQGGLILLPEARLDDGRLDVAIIEPRTVRHWLHLAWAVLRRRQRSTDEMEIFHVERVEITSDRVQPREIDGDVIEPSASMSVTVRPFALCLCVPAPAPAQAVDHESSAAGTSGAGRRLNARVSSG